MQKKDIRTGIVLFLITLIILGAVAFGFGEFFISAGNQPRPNPDTARGSLQIIYQTYTETFLDESDGAKVLEVKIVYPQIRNTDRQYAIDEINAYFERQKDAYLDVIATDGFHYAKGDKDASVPGEYEFEAHTYTRTPSVAYNESGFLSIVFTTVENTGGVRPNVFQHADNFNVGTGKHLKLTDLLGGNAEKYIYSVARRGIQTAEKTKQFIYYETYKEDVEKYYDPNDFYFSGDSLKVFYQPYTLAPYAAGIPTFDISLEDMRMRMKIPPGTSQDQMNAIYMETIGLLERNRVVFSEIFGLRMLAMDVSQKRTPNETVFPVIDPRFTRYDELAAYFRATYVSKTAESMLSDGRYKNVFGSLYGDINADTRTAYHINWEQYGFEITDVTEKEAKVTIYTTEESPAGFKKVTLNTKLVNENGKWLLDQVVY